MSQPKFRIVKRIGAKDLYIFGSVVYVAQRKLLDLYWVDCRFIDPDESHRTYDKDIAIVETYIQRKLHKHQPPQDEVVKTFYDVDG